MAGDSLCYASSHEEVPLRRSFTWPMDELSDAQQDWFDDIDCGEEGHLAEMPNTGFVDWITKAFWGLSQRQVTVWRVHST